MVLFQILKSGLENFNLLWHPLELFREIALLVPVSMALGWLVARFVDYLVLITFNDAFVEVSVTLSGFFISAFRLCVNVFVYG